MDEWQNRPLDKVYPFVFIDAIHYHVRENCLIAKKLYT
ncbi:transposase [Helcococcus ovis]